VEATVLSTGATPRFARHPEKGINTIRRPSRQTPGTPGRRPMFRSGAILKSPPVQNNPVSVIIKINFPAVSAEVKKNTGRAGHLLTPVSNYDHPPPFIDGANPEHFKLVLL